MFFPSGSAITPWPLGGAGKRTGKSGEHCLPFWNNKKRTPRCAVLCKLNYASSGEQIQFCDWLRRKESVFITQFWIFCFCLCFSFMNIILKKRNSFRKAWESGSSGLSSFLGRWFSNTIFLHDVAIVLTFSLKVNWVFGQEEKVWSSCQALQVWKIIGFGQKITGHCFWEQSKLILRTAAGSKMVIRESGHSQNFNCNLSPTLIYKSNNQILS